MPSPPDAVAGFFREYPASVADVAVHLRQLIRAILPDAREELDRSGHVVGYSFGAGYAGLVCTIIMSQAGVKLGLVDSVALPDPAGLLEGTGKRHRYISFKKASDFDRSGIRELISAAATRLQHQQRDRT